MGDWSAISPFLGGNLFDVFIKTTRRDSILMCLAYWCIYSRYTCCKYMNEMEILFSWYMCVTHSTCIYVQCVQRHIAHASTYSRYMSCIKMNIQYTLSSWYMCASRHVAQLAPVLEQIKLIEWQRILRFFLKLFILVPGVSECSSNVL